MTAQTMAEKACEAWFVLEAAALRGLPEPYVVRVTNHSTTELGLKTIDEFNAWAEALHADTESRRFGDSLHLTASGQIHDEGYVVAISAVVAAEAVAS